MITGLIIIVATVIFFSIIGYNYIRTKKFSISEYISAKNTLHYFPAVLTLIASAMGAWILFSPAETAVTGGITALIGYAVGSASALLLFSWLGLKLRSRMPKGSSVTSYAHARYGKAMSIIVILVSVFYMSVFLAAELTGIALAMKLVYNVPLVLTAVIVGIGTLIYTAFGGLKATIFTDKVQSLVILPLLALIFVVSLIAVGGFDSTISQVQQTNQDLLSFKSIPGIEFGITLIIAIIGAELFNHANWQRVYAAKNNMVVTKSFLTAGLLVFPIIFITGMFGFFALTNGLASDPSVALFSFILSLPDAVVFLTVVLAIALIMSSMDSLLSALVSIFTIDIARLKPKLKSKSLMTMGKWFTVVFAGLAILIATKGYSVLYLFLVADLVCVAAAFPTFYGLYSQRINGTIATVCTIIGIAAGAYFFPDPTFARGNLFHSFGVALVVPAILAYILSRPSKPYNFSKLKKIKNM